MLLVVRRTRQILVVVGICVAMAGVMGLPGPQTNPEALTQSLFVRLAMQGAFTRQSVILILVGLGCIALAAILPSGRDQSSLADPASSRRSDPVTGINANAGGGAFLQMLVVKPNAATAEKVRPTDEGIAHAKIAVVLERLGRTTDAQDRLALAAKVGGREPPWWREVGLKTVAVTLPQGFLHPDGTVRK
jgi:hypothetical protein